MKITVVKQAVKKQPNFCPWLVDDGGMPTRK